MEYCEIGSHKQKNDREILPFLIVICLSLNIQNYILIHSDTIQFQKALENAQWVRALVPLREGPGVVPRTLI